MRVAIFAGVMILFITYPHMVTQLNPVHIWGPKQNAGGKYKIAFMLQLPAMAICRSDFLKQALILPDDFPVTAVYFIVR